jgi:four helix bundle protein
MARQRGYSTLADPWRRAAMSVLLNTAEAVGKTSEADRNNRYAIARGRRWNAAQSSKRSG